MITYDEIINLVASVVANIQRTFPTGPYNIYCHSNQKQGRMFHDFDFLKKENIPNKDERDLKGKQMDVYAYDFHPEREALKKEYPQNMEKNGIPPGLIKYFSPSIHIYADWQLTTKYNIGRCGEMTSYTFHTLIFQLKKISRLDYLPFITVGYFDKEIIDHAIVVFNIRANRKTIMDDYEPIPLKSIKENKTFPILVFDPWLSATYPLDQICNIFFKDITGSDPRNKPGQPPLNHSSYLLPMGREEYNINYNIFATGSEYNKFIDNILHQDLIFFPRYTYNTTWQRQGP